MRLRQGNYQALIPSSCVAEVAERGGATKVPADALVLRLCSRNGVEPGDRDAPVLLRVGVADLQFWLACDAVDSKALARRAPAAEFVEEGSWLQCLGIFQENGDSRALPLLEGTTLIRFYKENSGVSS